MSPTKTKERPAERPRERAAALESEGRPMITPDAVSGAATTNGAVVDAPALQPPGVEGSGMQAAADGVAAMVSATIGGLWTNSSQSNAYAYLNGIGWRRLSAANATAHQAMLQIARLARDANAQVQCEDDGSVIRAIYAW